MLPITFLSAANLANWYSPVSFFLTELSSQGTVLGRSDLPPIRAFPFQPAEFLNVLRSFGPNGLAPFDVHTMLVRRGHILFGMIEENRIVPLFNLDGHAVIHHLNTNVTELTGYEELRRLGVFGPVPPSAYTSTYAK